MPINAAPAEELIPGYVATERLGAGGYGEVWKVEAPGGLHKAIKIIYGFHDEERASRELKSLDHVRKVRHPFLLSLERIEVIDGRLMIVTELADMSLMDRFEQCRKANLPGIPRDELINHMRDTADALDFMFQTHSLQHLDVKPENLLLVSGRAKVADFGLVKEIADKTRSLVGAMTPTYAAPEVFDGRATRQSDQYSLAIVYQEMLTGVLPFPGRTAAQLAAQHTRSRPQLSALPVADRDIIARALSKIAGDRFPSCRDLVDALVGGTRPVVVTPQRPVAPAQDRPNAGTRAVGADDTHLTSPVPAARPKSTPPDQFTEIIAERAAPKPPSSIKRPAIQHRLEVPEVQVSTSTMELPPPAFEAAEVVVHPTFFLAVGGSGALTLDKLSERLNERFTPAVAREAFPRLLVETDPTTIKKALAAGIDNQDTALLSLKQSHEYRGESESLLQWLGRRWLYNIPKSALTTGFRPWGRLALIDRAGQVVVKLRQRLTKLTNGSASQALVAAEIPAHSERMRVVLVGSCCGGTGGGMLLELAYAVRNLAKQLGKPIEVNAFITTSTLQCPTSKQLASANAVAFMQELQHYARCGAHGDNGADTRTALFEGQDFPLDQVYFVDLGDEITYETYDQQLEHLADYLYCDAATPLAAPLATSRVPQSDESLHVDVKVRSLRLTKFDGLSTELLPAIAHQLAAEVAQRWLHESPRNGVSRYLEAQAVSSEVPSAPPTPEQRALEKLTHSRTFVGFVERERPAEVPPEMRNKPPFLKQLAAFEWMGSELLTQLQLVSQGIAPGLSTRELLALCPRGFDAARLSAIAERSAQLAEPLVTEYLAQLRKLAELDHKAVQGPQLVSVLQKVAQREAVQVLKGLLPDLETSTAGQIRCSSAPLYAYLQQRAEYQYPFGCGRRTYLLSPIGSHDEELPPAAAATIRIASPLPHTYVCEELQDISLAQLALLHASKDPQALEAIDHLHTRVDVPWSELATPVS